MISAEWFAAITTVTSVVVGTVFTAGQVTGRIKDQETTLVRHEGTLNDHEDRLNDHDIEIERAKAWREGYNAGKGNRP